MNIPTEKELSSEQVLHQPATLKIIEESESWETWEAMPQDPFEINYDQIVSFRVVSGKATVEFTNGINIKISAGDFVRIQPKLKGTWNIQEKIINRYVYDYITA